MRRPERSVADRIHDAEESYRRAPIVNARRAEPKPAVFFASLPEGTTIELRDPVLGARFAPVHQFEVRRK